MNLSNQITKLRWALSHKLLLWANTLADVDIDPIYKMLDRGDIDSAKRKLHEIGILVDNLNPLFCRLRDTVEEQADDPLAAGWVPTTYAVAGTYCIKDHPVRIISGLSKHEADEVKREIARTGNWHHLHTVEEDGSP